jgi:hypothetical protein
MFTEARTPDRVVQRSSMLVEAVSTTVHSVAFKLVVAARPGSPDLAGTPTQQDTRAVLALARRAVFGQGGLVVQATAVHTVPPCVDIEEVWQLDRQVALWQVARVAEWLSVREVASRRVTRVVATVSERMVATRQAECGSALSATTPAT